MANEEWSLQINVAGEQFFKPGTFERLSDGPHEVLIIKSWREPASGKNEDGSPKHDNIVFELSPTSGPDKGKIVRKYKPAIEGEPGSVGRKEWKNLLASCVKDPASLEAGAKTLKAAFFQGKTVFVLVQNPPEGQKDAKGRTPYANINFITKDMVAELKTKKPAGNPAANGAAKGKDKEFEVEGAGAATPQPGATAADPLE